MTRARLSYGLLTSQNQGGGDSKQGLVSRVGKSGVNFRVISRRSTPTEALPAPAPSWYSIRIALETAGVEGITIFNGFFSVDNATNLVISFYETINGSTNFNNNILVPTGTGTRYPANDYKGFHAYDYALIYYDNAYISTWNQFDKNGVIITSMSYRPNQFNVNLWARNTGDETINNKGIAYSYDNRINVLYFILPISNPT